MKKQHVNTPGRHKVPDKQSREDFTKSASKTHWKNIAGNPMRGGIRL